MFLMIGGKILAIFLCKVSGVMSSNPDGEKRQDIIRNIIEEEGTENRWWGPGRIEVSENPRTGAPSIEVYIAGKKIGYVAESKIDEVMDNNEIVDGVVSVNLYYVPQYDIYTAGMFVPIPPTERMEYAVYKLLAEKPYLEKPVYTFEAYRRFLNIYRDDGNERAKADPDNGNANDNDQEADPGNTDDNGPEYDFGNANDNQKKAITTTEGPVLITAGPGTGKTYTLVQRTIYLIEKCRVGPENIFIATFTEKAAKELVTRITNAMIERGISAPVNEMYVGTFHSLCLRILKENLEYTRLKKNYKLLDDFDQIYTVYQNITKFNRIGGALYRNRYLRGDKNWERARIVCNLVNKLSEEMVDAEELIKDEDRSISEAGHVLKTYQNLLKDKNMLDFSAIQIEAFSLLNEHPEVLEQLQEKIRYIMIDEYQDTNYIQEQLVFLLGSKSNNICVVGDDDQGLYRFRGATIRNILEFQSKFNQGECAAIPLSINYRSDSEIVDFYNRWMRETYACGAGFAWGRYRLRKTIEAQEESKLESPAVVKISGNDDENDWHEKILRFINQLVESGKITDLNQLAFLFYSVKDGRIRRLADYLEANGIKVYSPRSGKFFQREEVRLLLGCLMMVFPDYIDGLKNNEFKTIWCKSLTDAMLKYYTDCYEDAEEFLDKNENAAFKKWIEEKAELHRNLEKSTDHAYTGLIYQMLQFEPFASQIDTDMDLALTDIMPARNIAQFTQIISKFEQIYNVNVLSPKETDNGKDKIRYIDKTTEMLFNSYLKLKYSSKEGEYEDDSEYAPSGCVSFLTIHQAKGMEFPVVFVDSLFSKPDKRGDKLLKDIEKKYYKREPFEPDEDIGYYDFWRLYYTAFSRAQNLLVLTCNEDEDDVPSIYFRELYEGLPSVDDESFNHTEFDFVHVKDVNIKKSFAFTSDISVYQTCGLQYKFYKELEFAPKRIAAMMFGTLVHQTIEDVHKAAIGGKTETITKDNINKWFYANYASLSQSERFYLSKPQQKAALDQVLRYVKKQGGDWSKIRNAEVDVSLVKPDYIIEGTIDLIRGEGNTVEIVDFKSEKRPDEAKDAEKIKRYKQQLQIYAHIIEERTGLNVSRMNLYYTGDNSNSPVISFPYEDTAVEETISLVDDTVHKILRKEFIACDKKSKVCNECDFRYFCKRHRKKEENV